jgi:hypothetical protein
MKSIKYFSNLQLILNVLAFTLADLFVMRLEKIGIILKALIGGLLFGL